MDFHVFRWLSPVSLELPDRPGCPGVSGGQTRVPAGVVDLTQTFWAVTQGKRDVNVKVNKDQYTYIAYTDTYISIYIAR